MVVQQNQSITVVHPNLRVWKRGPMRSLEKEENLRRMISEVVNFESATFSGWPPISLRISSVNHVVVLFLYAIPYFLLAFEIFY